MANSYGIIAWRGKRCRSWTLLSVLTAILAAGLAPESTAQIATPAPGVIEVIVDTTPPTPGMITGPVKSNSEPVTLTYSGAADSSQGSGFASVTLWMKSSANGTWAATDATSIDPAGSLTLSGILPDGTYYFSLRAADNAGNESPLPQDADAVKFTLDRVAPVITLNGESSVRLARGAVYVEPGATANDDIDGDLTSRIQVSGNVVTDASGEYRVSYSVTDDAGNKAEASRTVSVANAYSLTLTSPAVGRLQADPPPSSTGSYPEGTVVVISYIADSLRGADVEAWGGAQADPASPDQTQVTMDTDRAVSVALTRHTGSAEVDVTPDTATWSLLDGDGNKRDGTGDQTVTNVHTGAVSITYSPVDTLITPAPQESILAKGATASFRAVYEDNSRFTWGDVNGDDMAGDSDAALMLQRRVGLLTQLPGATADLAASVSGEQPAVIGAYDAALVLQRSSGSTKPFPADSDGDGIGPEPEGSEVSLPNFTVVRNVYFTVSAEAEAGSEIALPIWVDNSTDILGFHARVAYSADAVEFLDASRGNLAASWTAPVVNAAPGLISVAGAGIESKKERGSFCVLRFRARMALTADNAVFRLDSVEFNDGLVPVKIVPQTGAPLLEDATPGRGAECGGSVINLRGSNLNTVTRVLFGGVESPWVQYNPRKGTLSAVSPAGTGRVDIEAIAPGGSAKLAGAFEYFAPAVYLTLTPPTAVREGDTVDVPIWLNPAGTGRPSALTFRLYYDNYTFTVPQTEGQVPIVAGDAATEAGKTVTARIVGPGEILVTVSGSPNSEMQPGVLCTCRFVVFGGANTTSLMNISMVSATGSRSKSLATDAGVNK